MTNEEAIDVLKNDIEICTIQQKQACDMAIKALEQQPRDCKTCKHSDNGKCAFTEECHECMWENQYESQRWIPVSERLPDTDDMVLCWYEYYHWSREKVLPEYGLGCYLRETSAWWGEVANGKDVRVIAWMPLPQPYRESEE